MIENYDLLGELMGFPGGSDSKESTCNGVDPRLIPGSGRSPGEGNGKPLQYSCLENPVKSMKGQNDRILKEELLRLVGVAQRVKRLSTMWETRVQSLGGEDLVEKEMVTH